MRHFIIIDTLDSKHHAIAVDQIKSVSPYSKDGLKSAIRLIDDHTFYSSEPVKDVYVKITRAQQRR